MVDTNSRCTFAVETGAVFGQVTVPHGATADSAERRTGVRLSVYGN